MPSLIILDLLMPDVDGFEVLEWMTEHRVTVPVVVLTSSESTEHEERSLALGAKAFYRKPADLAGLDEVVGTIVDEWIESPEAQAPLQSAS